MEGVGNGRERGRNMERCKGTEWKVESRTRYWKGFINTARHLWISRCLRIGIWEERERENERKGSKLKNRNRK
jgi:hypothetical protein